MSRRASFGVIGTGFWGRNHSRVLSELDNATLVAVCDIDHIKAETISKLYGVDCYYEDKDLLKREDVEAVCICTPTTTHFKIASRAIEYGKHILIEKPIANTVKQARRVLEEAEKRRVKVSTGFIERFNPAIQRVKSLIEKGRIGDVVLVLARRVGKWPERIGDVGVIKDSALHDIDIVRFLFQEDPLTVYARAGSLGHRFEDYAQIILGFSGIKTAFVEANWLTPHKIRTLTVTGSEAIINVDYLTQELLLEDDGRVIKTKNDWIEPLKLELEHFADCIILNQKPEVSGLDGLKALQIAEAAIKSVKKQKVINLNLNC